MLHPLKTSGAMLLKFPSIWNQHESDRRTDNASENNHSTYNCMIPRYHPSVLMIVDYFKALNSLSCNRIKQLGNNISVSKVKSKTQQQQFEFQLAITNKEYYLELEEKEEKLVFREYFD